MVMRYYGNKEGLFAAAAAIDLRLPDLTAVPREKAGETLVRHFVERWESGQSDEVLTLLLRSATTNERAAEQMCAIFEAQVAEAVAAVIERPAEVSMRAGLIFTQLLGVALCRCILRLPAVVALDADILVVSLASTVQHYLTGALA